MLQKIAVRTATVSVFSKHNTLSEHSFKDLPVKTCNIWVKLDWKVEQLFLDNYNGWTSHSAAFYWLHFAVKQIVITCWNYSYFWCSLENVVLTRKTTAPVVCLWAQNDWWLLIFSVPVAPHQALSGKCYSQCWYLFKPWPSPTVTRFLMLIWGISLKTMTTKIFCHVVWRTHWRLSTKLSRILTSEVEKAFWPANDQILADWMMLQNSE